MSERFLDHWCHALRAKLTAFRTHEQIVAGETRPLPSPERIRMVNSAEKAVPSVFLRSGLSDLLAIVETLADAIESGTPHAERLPDPPTIMELGCGLGRLLRHVPPPDRARVIATDVNADSLEWCRANLPGISYHYHGPQPPIVSLPALSVDIVYAHSVFTHIPLERHAAWLREMRRVLRPGGWLVATFLGGPQQKQLLTSEQQATRAAAGAIQIAPEWAPGGDGPVAFGAVCQTVAHQEATVGAVFDVAVRRERHGRQDVLALRRR
jgi:SAM-dependent methyltransferase